MKRETTRTSEKWEQCGCSMSNQVAGQTASVPTPTPKKDCYLCGGTGKYVSETRTETIIEEWGGVTEGVEVIDAEEIVPLLEKGEKE